MSDILTRVGNAVKSIEHGWTSVQKAQAMASAIIALRPDISVEIGVFAGKGLVAMGLAHREIGKGMAIGIDPYSSAESATGQINPADHDFWSKLDHEQIYRMAEGYLTQFGIQNTAKIVRSTSNAYTPPDGIGFIRIDGNHGDQVLQDVRHYCPRCRIGALLHLDDLNWTGGSVTRASGLLKQSGWIELYRLDDGAVFQRVS